MTDMLCAEAIEFGFAMVAIWMRDLPPDLLALEHDVQRR